MFVMVRLTLTHLHHHIYRLTTYQMHWYSVILTVTHGEPVMCLTRGCLLHGIYSHCHFPLSCLSVCQRISHCRVQIPMDTSLSSIFAEEIKTVEACLFHPWISTLYVYTLALAYQHPLMRPSSHQL